MPSESGPSADDPRSDDRSAGLTNEEREGAATRAVEQVVSTLAAEQPAQWE